MSRIRAGHGKGIPEEAGGEPGALSGLRFLNTREASSAPELTTRLKALGADVLECPMLAFTPPASWEPFPWSIC